MSIVEYFRKKKSNVKITGEKSLSLKKSIILTSKCKHGRINNLVEFIKDAIIANGGDYEDIVQKLNTILEFTKVANEVGVNCNLSKIDEVLRDFFEHNKEVKYYPLKPHTAFYTKKDENAYYNYRGVTVMQDDITKNPIIYFGRRYEKAESHAKDTIFYFGQDVVVFRNETQARYDEIPLWGDGSYAEFYFDNENKLNKIIYRKMEHPRVKMWGKEEVCEFDYKANEFKITTSKIETKGNNDPKPTRKSMQKLADVLLNGK